MVKNRSFTVLIAIAIFLQFLFVSNTLAEIVFEDDFNDDSIDRQWTLVNAGWMIVDEQNGTLNMAGETNESYWVTGGSVIIDKEIINLITESKFKVDGSGTGYTATISIYDEWDINSVELGMNSDPYIGGLWLRIAVNGIITDKSLGSFDSDYHTYRIKYDGNDVVVYVDGIPKGTFGITLKNIKVILHANARYIGDSVSANFDYFNLATFQKCNDLDMDGYSSESGDCDDNDSTVHPEASEICDGKDNNCDGQIDEDFDIDGDDYYQCGDELDCNDGDSSINPGSIEMPGNALDENCDGSLGSCDPNATWKNHGQYVRCVAHEVEELINNGLITQEEGDDLINSAAQSEIGKN